MSEAAYPLVLFRYDVEFKQVLPCAPGPGNRPDLAKGSFSECTGLEATMEPKIIKSGGSNYGAAQRAGPVTFGTVVLKRGMTANRDLWKAFSSITEQAHSATRFDVTITVKSPDAQSVFKVMLARALPVKFKCGDLSARATEVGIEELHLAHEGLSFK